MVREGDTWRDLSKVRELMIQRKEHKGPEMRTGLGYLRNSRKAGEAGPEGEREVGDEH